MARVLPAEAAIDKEFDYLIPDGVDCEGLASGGDRVGLASGGDRGGLASGGDRVDLASGADREGTVPDGLAPGPAGSGNASATPGPGVAGAASPVRVGTMVRVDLGGRRVAGWILSIRKISPSAAPIPKDGVAGGSESAGRLPEGGRVLRPLALVSGWGPEPELVDLAGWAAWRWAGRRATLLATASPERRVPALPAPARRVPAAPAVGLIPEELLAALAEGGMASGAVGARSGGVEGAVAAVSGAVDGAVGARSVGVEGAVGGGGRGPEGPRWPWVLRLPPSADPTAVVAWLAQRGPTLVVVPALDRAAVLASRLRRAGADVAVLPEEWAQARAGAAVVIGSRAAAWGPCPGLAAVVVIDGHDPALIQEQTPTWSALDVAAERARRAGVPCVVISACPPVELLASARLMRIPPDAERAGWSVIDVVDRRRDDPHLGLFSRPVVNAVRGEGVVLCVLNRVGRARLLACSTCGTVADCERCGAAVASVHPEELSCPRCGLTRPVVCRSCTSTRLRQLRIGVSRAREELEALAGRPVGEITATSAVRADADVVVGTEAVLHRRSQADVVVFLDFDQHLLGPRLRAPEESLVLLARASRLTGGRHGRRTSGPGRVLVQTRLPDHPVLLAAEVADPGRLAEHEMAIRRHLRLPPVTALAAASGPGAPELVAAVANRPEPAIPLEVLGPDQGRWLLRAADHTALADALAGLPRPSARVRIDVDPVRV